MTQLSCYRSREPRVAQCSPQSVGQADLKPTVMLLPQPLHDGSSRHEPLNLEVMTFLKQLIRSTLTEIPSIYI